MDPKESKEIQTIRAPKATRAPKAISPAPATTPPPVDVSAFGCLISLPYLLLLLLNTVDLGSSESNWRINVILLVPGNNCWLSDLIPKPLTK